MQDMRDAIEHDDFDGFVAQFYQLRGKAVPTVA